MVLSPERVGLSEVNRAGVGIDGDGREWLCYAGRAKNLDLLSGAPGLEWKWEWGCVALPVTRENLLLLETVGGIEEATDGYVRARNISLSICTKDAGKYPLPPEGEPPPFQHQRDAFAAAQHLFEAGGAGFGNYAQMGCGKTRMAIDLMRVYTDRCALVVVQNSTALQWADNLSRLFPEAETLVLTGMPIPKRKAILSGLRRKEGHHLQVVVVNWEALGKLRDHLSRIGFDVMVADESTRLKDRNTGMSKAAFHVGQTCRYRYAMTGTPLGNSPEDLWGIYRFINPSIFGKNYWKFAECYFRLGGFTGRQFTGFIPERLPEFINKMYGCAYRITKSCITDMPEKCYEVVRLTMEGEQKALYDKMAKDMWASRLGEDGETRTLSVANALVLVTRLQQVTAGLFPSNEGETHCEAIPSVKTEWVTHYVSEAVKDGQAQLVVWCRFTKEIEVVVAALRERGVEVGVIAGNVKMEEREALRVAFNDRENSLRVLVCQTQAAAYGLDLPNADTMVFHTNSYSFLERSQAEDRGHRLGRVRPYNIIDVAVKGTVDVEVLAALKEKGDLASLLLTKGFLGIPIEQGEAT